jgi:antibiotic biosynthesis monooxygenase (ABM) superfamily enzyme
MPGTAMFNIAKYVCPSTGKTYHSFVPERFRDADNAVAWKHGLTREQYLKGIIES